MKSRMSRSVVRRPSLPLNADDERDLISLKMYPHFRMALAELAASEPDPSIDVSEGVLLHAVFEVGMAAVRERAEFMSYQESASDAEYVADMRKANRRPRKMAEMEKS